MRIPPYGGSLFDPARYPWLEDLPVTDRVVHEMLGALLMLRRRGGAAERLSYKGLDVEQIGHVYEGLLEFSCLRVERALPRPHRQGGARAPAGGAGAGERPSPQPRPRSPAWLAKTCDISEAALRKAMTDPPEDLAALHAACDNDAELAARVRPLRGLLRRDLRGLPTVFPAGSLVITQTGDRRATGTHYTPRRLAEEIVKYTLDPLCYSPGPADGAEEADWRVRPAAELLELKVLDPAMGSGAFLVSACRYLGERVVEAWERDGYPDAVAGSARPGLRPGRRGAGGPAPGRGPLPVRRGPRRGRGRARQAVALAGHPGEGSAVLVPGPRAALRRLPRRPDLRGPGRGIPSGPGARPRHQRADVRRDRRDRRADPDQGPRATRGDRGRAGPRPAPGPSARRQAPRGRAADREAARPGRRGSGRRPVHGRAVGRCFR